MKITMENYCDECDWVINTVCNSKEFWAHKVGRVRCPKCGAIMMPCNECAAETPLAERDCANCPWKNAKILDEKNDVFITQSDIFKMVEETNGFKQNQKVTGWHYSGDDEIVFDTNKTSHETEHYTLIEFVAQVDANFKEANDMKCNQFGAEVGTGWTASTSTLTQGLHPATSSKNRICLRGGAGAPLFLHNEDSPSLSPKIRHRLR